MRRILPDPDHDADTHRQRGSEAAVPILCLGTEAKGLCEQPLPRIVHGGSSLNRGDAPNFDNFIPLFARFSSAGFYTAGLNAKPSGTTPVLT
jgi:hypothetical protein